MPFHLDEKTVAELEKLLRYIAAILKQRGREILTQYPITPPQFVALQWLLEEGDLTIGELSNKMYLACSTTTDLIDRMERNGLVSRVRDEHDRRVVRIHLLEKGERIIEEVALALGKDPLEIRKRNFYGETDRNVTPYHQKVEDNIVHRIVAELEETADYAGRRRAIAEFNATSDIVKRGIALTPVKFGISFTATHFNQAGALVHVYTDGSVHLNHGGTEMGQGLLTKVAQVVAEELQIDIDRIKIT
ncbi:MAG: molybdopterin-dependent oxidoreductase, partial [Bacillales bacterium]